MKELTLVEKVQEWHKDKGIDKGKPIIQFTKLVEEVAELGVSIVKDDIPEVIDSLGDIQVVLLGLGLQMNLDLNTSLEIAYKVIKDRTGENVNGLFVKSDDLDPVEKTNKDLLNECISIANAINDFGAFIFVSISPHVKLSEFTYWENEDYTKDPIFSVRIYERKNYGEYKHDWDENKPNNVKELHSFLTDLLKEKKEGK